MPNDTSPGFINRSLPLDILGEIFVHAIAHYHQGQPKCPSQPKSPINSRRTTSHPRSNCNDTPDPLHLSHVCSHWRNVTLAMPILWSSISVCDPTAPQVELFKLWLDRSKNCSLDLEITFHRFGRTYQLKPVIEAMSFHSSRWKRLDFGIKYPDSLDVSHYFGTYVKKGSLKSLESIDLYIVTPASGFRRDLSRLFFRKTPSLHTLKLGYLDIDALAPVLPPWAQLRALECNRGRYDIFPALSQCNGLEVLKIFYRDFEEREDLRYVFVTLPNLQELKLSAVKKPGVLFRRLTLPRLCFLSVSLDDSYEDWNPLVGMLSRSASPLEQFVLDSSYIFNDEEKLADCVRLLVPCLSKITEMTLRIRRRLTDRTIEAFDLDGISQEQQVIFPSLKRLELSTCLTTDGVLSSMVASRFRNGCLVYIKVKTEQGADFHVQDKCLFELLVSEGLELDLIHNGDN
ncbi:hypothetical protein BDZ97DRAFT_1824685 [Flammula alnicola]|nr:hypothetical protein BDZ97DRAFT_1824685 [Flammula alnicola]